MVDCGIFDALWDLGDGSIEHLDDSLSNGHRSDMPYFNLLFDQRQSDAGLSWILVLLFPFYQGHLQMARLLCYKMLHILL